MPSEQVIIIAIGIQKSGLASRSFQSSFEI